MSLASFYMWSIEKVTYSKVHYFLDFVEAERWCMNEVVILNIKLAQHTKDVVQMLAVVPSASLLCPDEHILEVLTGAIRGGPNSHAILRRSLCLLAVQQNNTFIDRIWNGSNLVDVGIKDGSKLPTVLLLYGHLTCWSLEGVGYSTHHGELETHPVLLELELRQLRQCHSLSVERDAAVKFLGALQAGIQPARV